MAECICHHCNKTFSIKQSYVDRGKGKYCSKDCYNTVRVQRVDCSCESCGKYFSVTQYRFDKGYGKYCSRKCFGIARTCEKVERFCLRCGKSFEVVPSLVKEGGNYCSRSCYEDGEKVECICKQCHRMFFVYPSQIKHHATVYCSLKCTGLARSGENNPHWKGGYGDYRGENWRQQQRLARKRDGGICQNCHRKPNKGESRFSIHHIKPFRIFNGDYLAANDLSNLITLCRSCHPKAEHGKIAIQIPLL
jgi:Restriction endonuclease